MTKYNSKIQKDLNFTCQECHSVYQLLEIHYPKLETCSQSCFQQWKQLLHSHFQEQIILYLAQKEAQKDHDMTERNENEHDTK